MGLDNLASQPSDTYTTTGTGSLFHIATSASPYNWIKSEEKMGIIKGTIHDISQNIQNQAKYLEYGKAQFEGSSDATTIDNAGQPLGNRYFVSAAGKKCLTIPDNKIVDQYYVIDGMASPPGSTAKTNGLAFSAAATLQILDPSNITPFFKPNDDDSITFTSPDNATEYNTCKKISIVTDGRGSTDANYVSKIEADKLIASGLAKEAFRGNDAHHNQSHHHIVYGHNPSNWGSMTDFGGYVVGADIESYNIPHENIAIMENPISTVHTIMDHIDDDHNRIRRWTIEKPQKERNIVTGFFLGSMTVIGLFIVFRLLDRSAVSRFR